MIYLDHAATAPLRKEALEAMMPYLTGCWANASGIYRAARGVRAAIDEARACIAEAIGAEAEEIYFTSGGTEADNWAISGCFSAERCTGEHLLVSSVEHHAVLRNIAPLRERGIEADEIPVDRQCRISRESVSALIRPETKLVSVMLANNEVGTIQPICEIAGVVHAAGAYMHTDAVQAVGHIHVHAAELGVDLLSMSAHKFGGPKGIGALYIRKGTKLGSLMRGGAQERGMRAGTENTAGIVGMAAALRAACRDMNENIRVTEHLKSVFLECIRNRTPKIRINGDEAHMLPGHIHMTIEGERSDLLMMRLDMAGIAASAGSACTSGAVERSHVLRAMGCTEENEADLRLTIGYENTEAEMIEAAERIMECIGS